MSTESRRPKWFGKMRALDKKLIRDLGRLWAQGLAIALVMACGVGTIVTFIGAYRSLEETQFAFYDRYRFGSVFASADRAPRRLQANIERISGVSSVELRIVKPVLLDIEGQREPASGIAVSIPDLREARVNKLYVRHGRLPVSGRPNEVAVVERFANAHGFRPGDHFEVIMAGHKVRLRIAGIVLSPEYIYSIGPGDMVPDERRFGIFFMTESVLEGLFDMEGAFNNVSLGTLRSANADNIVVKLDALLKPYGGAGAHTREDHVSHAFLDAEMTQLRGMASIIPPIFLLVAAFLVNMILSRLVALEREQVGLLKAIGYSNLAIGAHYAKLVFVIALVGLAIGAGFGFWAGRGLTRLFASFFSFPFLIFRQSIDLYAIAGGLTIISALLGAAKAISSVIALPPAVAMRPPAPANYRNVLVGHLQRLGAFSQLSIMAFRHLVQRPVRAFLTTLGTSLSVALLITSLFSYDAIDEMIDTIFFRADRQDATITLAKDTAPGGLFSIAKLPGVLRAEPFRQTPVDLVNGHRTQRMSIVGISPGAELSRILDADMHPMDPPPNGIVLSEHVASKLDLSIGDRVGVTLLERDRRVEILTVVGLSQGLVGLTAYTRLSVLNRMLRDGRRISGGRVTVDPNGLDTIYKAIKATPAMAGIALQDLSRRQFQNTVEQNITTNTALYVGVAVIITFGVIYNSARIQLSERARELASLRVFGFTRAEVSSVLMIELAVIVLAAQPLGWILGYGFAWGVTALISSDLFRIPFVVSPRALALSSLVSLAAAIVSALIVRRRVDRLDLIRVLKTRE